MPGKASMLLFTANCRFIFRLSSSYKILNKLITNGLFLFYFRYFCFKSKGFLSLYDKSHS